MDYCCETEGLFPCKKKTTSSKRSRSGKDEQSSSLLKKRGKSQRTVRSSRLQEVKHQHGEVLNPEGKNKPKQNSRLVRLVGQPGNTGPFGEVVHAISVNRAGGRENPSSTVYLSQGGAGDDAAPFACLSLASKGPRMPYQGHECSSA